MKRLNTFIIVLGIIALLSSCGGGKAEKDSKDSKPAASAPTDFAGKTLNILCWEGYADVLFTKPFEEKYGCKVKGTYFGSSDELISKLTAGGGEVYDIVSPSADMAQALIEQDLVQTIDLKKKLRTTTHWLRD